MGRNKDESQKEHTVWVSNSFQVFILVLCEAQLSFNTITYLSDLPISFSFLCKVAQVSLT